MSFVRRSGGMGATSLAIETAFELSRTRRGQPRHRVCLVDLDF
jgi:cellulose biosynthesis protein BcsQ